MVFIKRTGNLLPFLVMLAAASLHLMCTSSCSDARSFSSFGKEVNIKGDPLSEKSIFSSTNVNMLVVDTFLVDSAKS